MQQVIPKKPLFILSLDLEGAWGMRGDTFWSDAYLKEREIIDRLLRLFEAYDIKATWATVGHLFLDQCKRNGWPHPEITRPLTDPNKDWFVIDPCTTQNAAP